MTQIPEFLTEAYAMKHRKRKRRIGNTALSWANSMDITEKEFNQYLVELGYQIKNDNTQIWERTPKGVEHSRKIFRKIYWDIDAFFDVLRHRGLMTRTYFYCEKCGVYNQILEEEKLGDRYSCHVCGETTEKLN